MALEFSLRMQESALASDLVSFVTYQHLVGSFRPKQNLRSTTNNFLAKVYSRDCSDGALGQRYHQVINTWKPETYPRVDNIGLQSYFYVREVLFYMHNRT